MKPEAYSVANVPTDRHQQFSPIHRPTTPDFRYDGVLDLLEEAVSGPRGACGQWFLVADATDKD